jgi:ankyrin repeat protein
MATGLRVKTLVVVLATALLAAAALPPDSPLADAAMRGDAATVRTLLARGVDVNAAQGDGMTALHWAAERGDAEVAQLLLGAGADVKAVTRIGSYTPLHLASKAASGAIVRMLVQAGADVRAVTSNSGATALHLAARGGDPEAVAALLEHGADVNALEPEWGQTPLMFAAAYNRAEVIEVLLGRGADPGVTTKVVSIAARVATEKKADERLKEVMKSFQKDGHKPTPAEVQEAIQAKREVQRTTTDVEPKAEEHYGPWAPSADSYEALVGEWGGLTALLHAARQGNIDAAMALLDGGAAIDQPSAGDHTTPLLMAAINGQYDLALRLIERGANPNLASVAGAAPLFATINAEWSPRSRYPQPREHEQQRSTYMDVMQALLDAGAQPNVQLEKHLWYMEYTFAQLDVDTWGATPFWRAAHALDIPAMRLLLKYGADPEIPTRTPEKPPGYGDRSARIDQSGLDPIPTGGPGVLPFHAAAGFGGTSAGRAANHQRNVPNGWLPAVKFFVEELGANVNARDFYGYSAVHHAAGRGNNELILYLVSQGADVSLIARTGQTTADMANGPETGLEPFPATIELLQRLGSRLNPRFCGIACPR